MESVREWAAELKEMHRRIAHRFARRGIDSSERLGRHRWVVERTLAWLSRYRRLGATAGWALPQAGGAL
jgi:hypothetical protein